MALTGVTKPETRAAIQARLTPQFTSTDFGQPGYAQLSLRCAIEITTGADDGSEMGAFSFLQQPQRRANLLAALDEYLRFGLEAGMIEKLKGEAMKGDFTRWTFKPEKHYHGVLKQQGRVDLDAEWNEQGAIKDHRIETETLDVVGPSGAPVGDPGFMLSASGGGANLSISAGRAYVDGICARTISLLSSPRSRTCPASSCQRPSAITSPTSKCGCAT